MTDTIDRGGKFNLIIPQGETFRFTFRYKNADGTAKNLDGYTARMQFRETYDAAAFLYEATTGNGALTVDASNGDVILEIPATTTSAWTWRSAVYDLEIVDPAAKVTRLVQGRVKVTLEVTH